MTKHAPATQQAMAQHAQHVKGVHPPVKQDMPNKAMADKGQCMTK